MLTNPWANQLEAGSVDPKKTNLDNKEGHKNIYQYDAENNKDVL